jgi:hypothetical protein
MVQTFHERELATGGQMTQWPADQVERRSVSALVPYARNARTHSDEQVAQIAASIREWGYDDFRFCVENDNYAVVADGTVFRVCRQQTSKTGRIIRRHETIRLGGSADVYGYRVYRMMVDGRKRHVKGHRLVANAFLGERDHLCVNHRNGQKQDNSAGNLEWVTVAQNNTHAIATGLFDPRAADQSARRKVLLSDFVTIHAMHRHFGIPRAQIARRNRICRQTVDTIIQRVDAVFSSMGIAA